MHQTRHQILQQTRPSLLQNLNILNILNNFEAFVKLLMEMYKKQFTGKFQIYQFSEGTVFYVMSKTDIRKIPSAVGGGFLIDFFVFCQK